MNLFIVLGAVGLGVGLLLARKKKPAVAKELYAIGQNPDGTVIVLLEDGTTINRPARPGDL